MRELDTFGDIDIKGKLHVANREFMVKWIESHAGKFITIKMKVRTSKQTHKMMGYYRSVCLPMITEGWNELGNRFTHNQVHQMLNNMFNYEEVETPNGGFVQIPKSTADLDTYEFSQQFLAAIREFAAIELYVNIPDPDKDWKSKLKNDDNDI